MTLRVGQHAPDFDIETTDGHRTLRQLLEMGALILVFYPDDTTAEAASTLGVFRDQHESFANFSAHILAVSTDDLKSHFRLLTSESILFSMGTDPDLDLARKYEAAGDDGRARRVVYVVGEDGRISGAVDPFTTDQTSFGRIYDALGLG